VEASSPSFLARHEFLIRRLHSLSGLVPVGAYMCVHLLTNASVLNGPGTFQDQVDTIHGLGRALPIVEWTFIFIPILFHAIIGVVMIGGGMPNTNSYPLPGNVRYTLQRATGMIAFAFIAWHVIHMHGWFGAPFKNVAVFPLPTGGAQFDPHRATSSAAAAIQASLGVQVLYAIGLLACVYHLANGLWTMGITWGVWTSPAAQRRANYVAVVFGLVLAAIGLGALVGMGTTNVADARLYEQVRQEQRKALEDRYKKLKQQNQPAQSAAATTLEGGQELASERD
jgi:succinate dehydrogenase / fumarate reductase cytochrome b subunit